MKFLKYLATAILLPTLVVNAATRSNKAQVSRSLDVFSSIVKNLQTEYVDTIDAQKSINVAIDAMLMELDPYTEYIPEDKQENFRTISTGEYGGIGSFIMQRNGNVYISEPHADSPALLGGLRAGDLIVAIDGDTVLGMPSDKVSERLRGQAGTIVKVLVKRPYVADSMLTFDIKRKKIQVHPVPYFGMLDHNVGYIALTTFSEKSYPEVKNALRQLQANPDMKSLVLDLRNNGGGVLDGAVDILGLFLPKGTEVLRTRGKGQVKERIYKTSTPPVDVKMPIVVLINSNSASASEIVAGALQDLDRAVIVGNRSYGKGLVQGSRQLPYNGLLKLTTAKYYIPSGRLIQAIDYSHRNPDGSVGRIPDSLTNEYKTRVGRIVRDGGGITPDVKVDRPEGSRLLYNIIADNWAFDFANRYYANHPTIAQPEDFEVSDELFLEFKAFIDPKKFNYDKVCETMLDDLEKAAKTEGYFNDSTKMQFDALRASLKHNLDHDLDNNRKDISSIIANELMARYYQDRGQIIQALKSDEDAEAALKVLNSPDEYKKLLSPK